MKGSSDNSLLCEKCVGLCCRYFALPIENPKTAADFDDIRWYLAHEGVSVFIEEGQWYVNLANKCRFLGPGNRCLIYAKRPRICRYYNTRTCDYHGGEYTYEHLFTTIEQLQQYARDYLAQRRSRNGSARNSKNSRSSAARAVGKNGSKRRNGRGSLRKRAPRLPITGRRARTDNASTRARTP